MADGTDSRSASRHALPADALVGVVGPVDGTDPGIDAVVAAGGTPQVGTAPADIDGADALLAVGESAAAFVARDCPAVPLLAVDAGPGFQSVPRESVESVVEHLLDGCGSRGPLPSPRCRPATSAGGRPWTRCSSRPRRRESRSTS